VKNIAEPVRVYRVALASAVSSVDMLTEAPGLPDKPSVAVLPYHEYERRPRAGVFRRRHRRRHHYRHVALSFAVRDRTQFVVHL
jgi:hypothetical protein